MDHKKLGLSVPRVNLVVRHLRLENTTPQKIRSAIADIEQIYGLDALSFDQATQVMSLAYDASQIMIEGIEELLVQHGLETSHGWWTRFKEDYYRLIERSSKDDAQAPANCCCKTSNIAKSKNNG